MFEDSVSSLPSIWASMNSWFTPTVLFLFLNVMIGTIAIASNLSTSQKHQDPQNQNNHGGLARSPSVLQRIKSINLYRYRSHEPHPATSAVASFDKSPDNSENTHYIVQHSHEPEVPEQPQFTRSPSLLQRLKSSNFYIPQDYASNPPHTTAVAAATTTLHKSQGLESKFQHDHFEDEAHLEVEDHFEVNEDTETEGPESEQKEQSLDEIFSQLKPLQGHHVNRTKSDTNPTSGEVPTKLPKKMKKSASSKSPFAHFQEDEIVEIRRPATAREKKHKVADDDDEEVDARADDFINKFKQQLKMQRLDSIVRYKDMINRGA